MRGTLYAQIGYVCLEGLAAALLAIIATAFVMWASLFAFAMPGGFHPFLLVTAMMAALFAAMVALPILAFNLPLAALVSCRFHGPRWAAVLLGLVCGALEGYALGQVGDRASVGWELMLTLYGGVGGAAFAWRIWVKGIRFRRTAGAIPA